MSKVIPGIKFQDCIEVIKNVGAPRRLMAQPARYREQRENLVAGGLKVGLTAARLKNLSASDPKDLSHCNHHQQGSGCMAEVLDALGDLPDLRLGIGVGIGRLFLSYAHRNAERVSKFSTDLRRPARHA